MINNVSANTAKQTPLEQKAPVVNQASVKPQSLDTSTTAPASTTSASDASASEENIFSDTSSLTVIMSKDYRGETTESWTNSYSLKGKEEVSINDVMVSTYGKSAMKNMTEGEKNSAMWSIIDNNRWMVDNINETYTVHQIASLVQDEIEGASEEDVTAMTEYLFEYRENAIKQAKTESEGEKDVKLESTQEELEAKNAAKLSSLEEKKSLLLQNMDGVKLSQLESKVLNSKLEKFDMNFSRTDQILPELIEATDFTIPINPEASNVDKIFAPDLRTLRQDRQMVDEQMTETIDFDAKNPQLSVTSEMMEAWKAEGVDPRDGLQSLIAQNYGLTEEGDNSYSLANSYAGMGVLAALGKEEGNNEIFKGKDEDLTTHLDTMTAKMEEAIANGEEFVLHCPNTEVNAMHDGRLNGADLRKQLVQDSNKTQQIQYLHVNSPSISLTDEVRYVNEDGEEVAQGEGTPTLTGMDILAHVDYEGGTLADALNKDSQKGDADKIVTGYSALMQIASNNPSMLKAIEEAEAEFDAKAKTFVDTGAWTQEQYDQVKMLNTINGINFAQAAADYDADTSNSVKQGDELVLENIQYIVTKETKQISKMAKPTASTTTKENIPEDIPEDIPENIPDVPDIPEVPEIPEEEEEEEENCGEVDVTPEDDVDPEDIIIENPKVPEKEKEEEEEEENCGEVDVTPEDDVDLEDVVVNNKPPEEKTEEKAEEKHEEENCGEIYTDQTPENEGNNIIVAPPNPATTATNTNTTTTTTETTETSTETKGDTGGEGTGTGGGNSNGNGNGETNGNKEASTSTTTVETSTSTTPVEVSAPAAPVEVSAPAAPAEASVEVVHEPTDQGQEL